ncbi:hypothetical protein Tco_0012675 [Tanacetum coccineum]
MPEKQNAVKKMRTFSPKTREIRANFNEMSIEINKKKELRQLEQIANLSSRRFNFIYDDDDDYEENTVPLNEITYQIPPSIAITPVLPTMEPNDSLIMRNEELSTILEKESNEFIKSSIEDLVPIPSESKDSSESDDDESSEMIKDQNSIHHLSGSPTSSSDHVVTFLAPSLTPTGDSDFLLEEIEDFISLDESISPDIDDGVYDSEGDTLFLEKLLNDDPLTSPKVDSEYIRDSEEKSDLLRKIK